MRQQWTQPLLRGPAVPRVLEAGVRTPCCDLTFNCALLLRCTSFTASEGEAYCRANGMSAVSLDNSAKERELSGLLVR